MRRSIRGIAIAALSAAAMPAVEPAHAQSSDMAIKVSCNTALGFLAGYGDGFTVVTPPSHGDATFADNILWYTPALGYSGLDTFYYQYQNPFDQGPTDMQVYVTVGACAAPVAQGASFDVPYQTPTPLTLAATDANPGGPFDFTYAVVDAPAHGSVDLNGNVATYTPESGYSGADAFTFTASTIDGTSAPATVSITVGPSPPRLVLSVDDGRDYARYGEIVDYVVTLANDGGSTAPAVSVAFSLSAGFDGDFVDSFCFGDGAGASCAPDPFDPLRFAVALPPGRSLVWLVEAPVRMDADGATADFGASADAASSVDSDVLVIHRDGFDASAADAGFRRVLERALQRLRGRSGEGGKPASG